MKAAHDVRNRVTAILGFCSLLQNDDIASLSAKQHEYLEDIVSNTYQLLGVIEKISDLEILKTECSAIENSLKELKIHKKA
jgi:signal transduction histidine kinase